ncbi:glycosyltransferase [Candidatus Bathyarchaeota archaeon]|nr:glycosyltransferase [Candidatus Bathyarchaeota archaeon]
MRILFVVSSNSFDFHRLGGIETSIKELALFLVSEHNDVTIYQINKAKKGKAEITTDFRPITIHYGNISDIRKKLLLSKFDVINFIHTPFESMLFTVLFLVKKYLFKITTTKFFFTYPPFRKHDSFQVIKYKYLIDKCFTFSKRLMDEVKLRTSNVYFLVPPVSDYFFKLHGERKQNSKINIMYLGRLSKDKGLDLVIDIYQNLDRNRYCLRICGYFANENDRLFYLKKLNSLALNELKIVERNTQLSFFTYPPIDNCDILLLPYQNLTGSVDLPLLVLEGVVSGCKVITSSIGDIPLLKGNIYCVTNFHNAEDFVCMIEKVANKRAKKYNYNEFSIKSIGKKYLEFLMLN